MGSLGNDQPFIIPTIDISDYLQDPNSPRADVVVERVRNACASSGFFQLVGHGVPEALQHQAFEAAKRLFGLPHEEKLGLRGSPGRGYEVIGTQTIEPGKKPDLKEGFFVGREMNNRESRIRRFREPNIWPSEDQIAQPLFKEPLLEYFGVMLDLSYTLMQIFSNGMKHVDTSVITQFCEDPIAAVRLLHYPPHPQTDDDTLVGTGAHTDFGAITLLLQDGNSGLQVLNPATNEWHDVLPRKDAYVVNIGDVLDVWTNGTYKSTVHRVINTSGTERYSIPFFFDGNADCSISPLDGQNGNGERARFTVEEHMLARYAASYKNS